MWNPSTPASSATLADTLFHALQDHGIDEITFLRGLALDEIASTGRIARQSGCSSALATGVGRPIVGFWMPCLATDHGSAWPAA